MSAEEAVIETKTLLSLEGVRTLQGVSFDDRVVPKKYSGDVKCNHCTFVLDDVTYTAVEDPDDGYRSSMEHLLIGGACTNMFPLPCYVVGRFQLRNQHGDQSELLKFYDIFTGECVLEVGTDNTDDYYPSFVASFHPEAMAANKYATQTP